MFCVFVAVLVVFLLPRASVVADASRISLFFGCGRIVKVLRLVPACPLWPINPGWGTLGVSVSGLNFCRESFTVEIKVLEILFLC